MKKILAVLLCLMLAAGCAQAAAETVQKDNYTEVPVNGSFNIRGVTPAGYKAELAESEPTLIRIHLSSEDAARPVFDIVIALSEEYFDRERLNDMSEEERMHLVGDDSMVSADITVMETAYGTQVMILRSADPADDFASFVTLYKGYEVAMNLFPGEAGGGALTDEQIAMAMQFLSDLDFVPME